MIQSIFKYLKETKIEMKKVNWPTRKETARFTLIVILFSLFIALLLGGFDYLFRMLLLLIVGRP